MQAQRSFSRPGVILSLLGGALAIYGMFFLPMVFGNGGNCLASINTPSSEWTVVSVSFYLQPAKFRGRAPDFPLLAVLYVLGTGIASFFRDSSPKR